MALFRRAKKERPDTDDLVIDLRDKSPSRGDLVWGMPSRCPECNDFGYLDQIDVERQLMRQHCPTCQYHWTITREEIDAQDALT